MRANKVTMELSARIMQYVEMAPEKKAKVKILNQTMGSEKLIKELHMSQRGKYYMAHPLFEMLAEGFSAVFVNVCCFFERECPAQATD